MKTIAHLLKIKGNDIWSIAPDASVYDAIELMADKEVGALLVLESGKLAGIISERDYARKVILKGKSSKETPVREIMNSPVIYTTPDQTVEKCMVGDDGQAYPASPRNGGQPVGRHCVDRGSGQGYHFRSGVPDTATGELHSRTHQHCMRH